MYTVAQTIKMSRVSHTSNIEHLLQKVVKYHITKYFSERVVNLSVKTVKFNLNDACLSSTVQNVTKWHFKKARDK